MFTNQNKDQKNKYYMNLALNYARMNLGNTKTNPSVGCVIIKNGNILGAASTSINGRPHAEYNAIKSSNHNFKDSILYSTEKKALIDCSPNTIFLCSQLVRSFSLLACYATLK